MYHNNPPEDILRIIHSRSTVSLKRMMHLFISKGCVWGGRVPYVIEMMEELSDRTDDDLSRDVIIGMAMIEVR